MATLSSPVCDRCEERPALFECNNCSTGDEVFYLCNGCHGLIHVGKFKSHSVASLVDKAAKQSISGSVEKLQQNDDLVAARLELVNASKKQLQDCITVGSADFEQVFDSMQSHLDEIKKDCWEQISGILQPRLEILEVQAHCLEGVKEKLEQCLTTGKAYESDLPAECQEWAAEAEALCEKELPDVDLELSVTFSCPAVAVQNLFRMFQLPQHRVEGVLAPGTVLDDVRIAERCFLNGNFLFHRHTPAHIHAVQKLSEEIGAACGNQPQPFHLNPVPNYLYAVRNSSGIWHRACIEQLSNRSMAVPKSINVYLVDISSCFQCRVGDLRLLPLGLANRPFMSVYRGCLSLARGLECREFRWEFSDLVVNKKCKAVVKSVQDGGLFPCRWVHTIDVFMISSKTGAVFNVADVVKAKLEEAGVLRQASVMSAATPAFVPIKLPTHATTTARAVATSASASGTNTPTSMPLPLPTPTVARAAASGLAGATAVVAVNSDMPLPLPLPAPMTTTTTTTTTTQGTRSPVVPAAMPTAADAAPAATPAATAAPAAAATPAATATAAPAAATASPAAAAPAAPAITAVAATTAVPAVPAAATVTGTTARGVTRSPQQDEQVTEECPDNGTSQDTEGRSLDTEGTALDTEGTSQDTEGTALDTAAGVSRNDASLSDTGDSASPVAAAAVDLSIETAAEGELPSQQQGSDVQPDTAGDVQPDAVQPDAVQPDAVQPDAVQPDAVQPDAVQPDAVQPVAVQPDTVGDVQPDAVQPDAVQPDAVQPDAVQPDAVQPVAVQPDAVQPDAVQPDAVQSDAVQPDAVQPDAVQPDTVGDVLPDAVGDNAGNRNLNDSGLAVSSPTSPAPPYGEEDDGTTGSHEYDQTEMDETALVHSCLVEGAVMQVSIVHGVDERGYFWPQFSDPDLCDDFLTMMDDINDPTIVETVPFPTGDIFPGNYCLARYSADGRWYRGLVEENNADAQEVFIRFLDYGNSEYVHYSRMASLAPRAYDIPIFAFECSLHGMESETLSDMQIQAFVAEVADVDVTLTVVSVADYHYDVTVTKSTTQNDGSLLECDLLEAISNKRRDSFVVTDDPDLDLAVKTWADATSSPPEHSDDAAAVQPQQQQQEPNDSTTDAAATAAAAAAAAPATSGETTAAVGNGSPRCAGMPPTSRLAAVALNTVGAPIRTILQRGSDWPAASAGGGANAAPAPTPLGFIPRHKPVTWPHSTCPAPIRASHSSGRDRHRDRADAGGSGPEGKRKSSSHSKKRKSQSRRQRSIERRSGGGGGGGGSGFGSSGSGGGGGGGSAFGRPPQPTPLSS